MAWSTPDDLEAQLARLWERGRLLVNPEEGGVTFPMPLRLRRPDRSAMSDRFDDVRCWLRVLEEGSKVRRGFGYDIQWTEVEHRQLGRNRIAVGALVPTRDDALRMIGKQRQAERFERLRRATVEACPELRAWIAKKPLALLEHADDWEKILSVLACFRAQPRPLVYLRQLEIPGVDTKFIEPRRPLLIELLDCVLPADAVEVSAKRHFEGRYGLLSKPDLVRFRILDKRHYVAGLSDLTVPASQFGSLDLAVRRVFITENEINGLCFPDVAGAAVIFGLGYGLDRLSDVPWLRDRAIFYWGDIDTHGFAILSRLRATFPNASSLLMDRDTLLQHESLWVQEDHGHPGPLARLTADEHDLFDALVGDRFGKCVRLEQERIGFAWVNRALEALAMRSGG